MLPKINLHTFKEFLRSGQIGGVILLVSVVISLLIANSSLYEGFATLLHYEIGFNTPNIELKYPTELWINDGLMAIFFLLVGLEIKREIVEGELSSVKKAAMPVFAALGGMLVPALIYFLINRDTPTASGWGIPMATDIAFALAVISMLGKSVPASLKIFLAALAIVDDLGAILVIALFYTGNVHLDQLLYSAGILALLALFNRFGVKNLVFYLIPGLFLWYFIHHSGIHATIAGVLLAFTIPTNNTAECSPLEKLEHFLTRPVNLIIMPVFALANTLIHFESGMVEGLGSSLGLGIIAGLLVGKTVGIFSFSWLSVKLKWSQLPSGARWPHILGLGMLGGIGFTMSVFIALLSFDDVFLQSEAKFSILIASFFAGVGGYLILVNVNKKKRTKA
ncbi:Na+/H+ antiporter NhaA [Arcticibacter eurypsychrophilus]|uniref:Na+/H+ antiporter NhaA n=1 Tax=Arcticibacter eurypsychrophilus TaxID=1434752 RepID=UPI00084DCB86|nr:Na+/H+ antiporter NhaA [Arcticibacter eurypsychrophilus]